MSNYLVWPDFHPNWPNFGRSFSRQPLENLDISVRSFDSDVFRAQVRATGQFQQLHVIPSLKDLRSGGNPAEMNRFESLLPLESTLISHHELSLYQCYLSNNSRYSETA